MLKSFEILLKKKMKRSCFFVGVLAKIEHKNPKSDISNYPKAKRGKEEI